MCHLRARPLMYKVVNAKQQIHDMINMALRCSNVLFARAHDIACVPCAASLQVPLPFVNGLNDTWAVKGSKRVCISQPSSGLDKRQCTMQLTFGPGNKLVR